jgi:hypothetical protein
VKAPVGYWNSITTTELKEFISEIGIALNVEQHSDWYRVSQQQLRSVSAMSAIEEYVIHFPQLS